MQLGFQGTYRVPFKQSTQGIKKFHKEKLMRWAYVYDGTGAGLNNKKELTPANGNQVTFTVPKYMDATVKEQLNKLGFKTYKYADVHDAPKYEHTKNKEFEDIFQHRGKYRDVKVIQVGSNMHKGKRA